MGSLGRVYNVIIYEHETIVPLEAMKKLSNIKKDILWLIEVEDVLGFISKKSYFDHNNYDLVFKRGQILNAYEEATGSFWNAFDKIKERLANETH